VPQIVPTATLALAGPFRAEAKGVDGIAAAGPASAYPMFRTPASTCFSGPKDVFVPGSIVDISVERGA